MPKRKYASKSKRSTKRRRLVKRRPRYRITRQLTTGMSANQLVKMRYVDRFTINPALGSLGYHDFSANSIYDPDVTGVGHQPLSYDQWSNFYNHYCVIGATIKVTFVSPGGTVGTDAAICGIQLNDDTVAPATSSTEVMEQAKAKWRFMTASQASGKTVVKHGFSPKRFFGIKDMRDNTTRVGAQFGQNPIDAAIFRVFIAPLTGSQDIDAVNCIVELNYRCLLSERRDLTQS